MRFSFRHAAAAVSLAFAPVVVHAQGVPASQPAAQPVDSARVALVRQLLAVTHSTDLMFTSIEASLGAQRAGNPGVPPAFWDRLLTEARAHRADLEAAVIPIYARHFSDSELRQLIAFYQTPIGQKFVAEQPALLKESMQAGQEWGRQLGTRVAQQMMSDGTAPKP